MNKMTLKHKAARWCFPTPVAHQGGPRARQTHGRDGASKPRGLWQGPGTTLTVTTLTVTTLMVTTLTERGEDHGPRESPRRGREGNQLLH